MTKRTPRPRRSPPVRLSIAAQLAILATVGVVLTVPVWRLQLVDAPLARPAASTPPQAEQGTFRPTKEQWAGITVEPVRVARDLPVSLPSTLVEQRPDIRSAEAQMHAASAEIGVAVANRLPQISLTGNAGVTANRISQLFMLPGTAFWTLAGNATQTVFDAGTLLHKQRAAEAAFDEAAQTFRSTVITAFQNVADSLHAVLSDADTLKAAYAAERAAFDSLTIARRQS